MSDTWCCSWQVLFLTYHFHLSLIIVLFSENTSHEVWKSKKISTGYHNENEKKTGKVPEDLECSSVRKTTGSWHRRTDCGAGGQNNRSRWSLGSSSRSAVANPEHLSVLLPSQGIAGLTASRPWSQTTTFGIFQRIRDLPTERIPKGWNPFDFPDNPLLPVLANLLRISQLLFLHITYDGFPNWQRSKWHMLEEKRNRHGHKTTASRLTNTPVLWTK